MTIEPIANLPYWKGLWSVISGTICRCDKELVNDEIKNATSALQEGLLFFKPFTESSLQTLQKTNPPPRMFDLISKLAPLLNLDASITWDLVCNFMLYEYRNCAETFASQLNDLTSMKVLIEDLWSFFYTERITLVKCLKLLVEYRENQKHPHYLHFKKFFDEVLLGNLLESLRKQIESLKFISPPVRSQLFTDDHLHQLYNNSLIEMRELLHIFTIILHEVHIAENQFVNIYGSISGEPRRLVSTKNHEDKEAVAKKILEIQYSQTALLVVGLDMMKHSGMEDWIRDVRLTIQDTLEHKCLRDGYPQDGPVFLAWMLANYMIEPENVDLLTQYRPFGIRAVQLGVFNYIKTMLESEMIQENTLYALTVRKSIYNLFVLLAAFVDEDKFDSFTGIYEACAAILSFPETSKRFYQEKNEEGGLWLIVKYAIRLFPYRFEPLTVILIGLAGASHSSAVETLKILENLPSITLEISRIGFNPLVPFKPYAKECLIHKNNYVIPPNRQFKKLATLQKHQIKEDGEIILWNVKANFWDAFHSKIEQLLYEATGGIANLSENKALLLDQVCLGFKLLEKLLSTDINISNSMVIPTELSFEIINRFSYPVLPVNVYLVVAACIKISSKLVSRYPEDVLTRMRAEVYPKFDNQYQNTSDFAQAVSFDGGLIASWLSSIETIQHSYPILDAYLDTLLNYLIICHSKEALYNVEIPGMIMLLQSVLPKLDSWYFKSDSERVELWLKSIYCLHQALEQNPNKKDDLRGDLRHIVTYNLLHLEPRHALLKLVRMGEKTLRNKMMGETDWIAGKGFKLMKSVQFALSVVDRLLNYRNNFGSDERSPLEAALYASPSLPNALLIVPTIVDYLYVWFSTALQAMAVRLLKKFAEGFSMSLLVCMGMDGTAIRETFASRLMSPTCGTEVKVAILELVTVCLDKQPGLTEALFNIMHQAERKRIFPRSADEFLTEGCTRFLDLYLTRIKNEKDIVHDRLYDSTMNLLRAMWHHRNEILVNFFRKRPDFWSKLFAPLFRILVPNVKGYSQILDIITLEIFTNTVLEQDFIVNLEKLLDKNQLFWNKLSEYIFNSIPDPEIGDSEDEEKREVLEEQIKQEMKQRVKPLYEINLNSWYQLLVVLTSDRTSKAFFIDSKQAQVTTKLAIDQLLVRLKQPPSNSFKSRISQAKLTMLLSSVSLRCISTWKRNCIGQFNAAESMKEKLVEAIQEISQSYRGYGKPLRQTLISLTLVWIELVGDLLTNDKNALEYLIKQSCVVASGDIEELRQVAKSRQRKNNSDEAGVLAQQTSEADELQGICESIPATLTMCLLTKLLKLKQDIRDTIIKNKSVSTPLQHLMFDVLICVGLTLQKHPYARFSKNALNLLSTVIRSFNKPVAFNEEAMAKLWLALIPPKDIKNSVQECLYDDCSSNMNRWRCQEWWPIYTAGLELVTSLVSSENLYCYVSPVIIFLASHEHLLTESSTLLRHAADSVAADLIQSMVSLISTLSSKPIFWDSAHQSIREALIKCLYLSYDSTVNLLLRPRILKFIIDGISVESAEELQNCDERQISPELALLVNKLILINSLCAQCFIKFSPCLNALVDTINTQEDFWYASMAEINFGPPQMSISSGPRLTYGAIITSTQLFTQAQWQFSNAPSSPQQSSTNISSSGKEDREDSAKKEWERATPENLRRLHRKDLRKMLYTTSSNLGQSVLASASSSKGDLASYLSGYDLTVPLLSSPRLIKRPFDPLICENIILSRATALIPLPPRGRLSRGSSPAAQLTSQKSSSPQRTQHEGHTLGGVSNVDPWFASMEENNTRLGLEVNIVLLLCQALEGVRSPRLAMRDRQLIIRETATELNAFFDFLEHCDYAKDWKPAVTLLDADMKRKIVTATDVIRKLPARLKEGATIQKIPTSRFKNTAAMNENFDQKEVRSKEDLISSGGFKVKINSASFLPLLGKLLKTMVESLDSAQFI